MTMGYSEISLEEFVSAARNIAERGLLQCSSGNMSQRINDKLAVITGRGSWLERLTKDDVAVCRIADGRILHGRELSVENRFHLGILRERGDVNVVLHFQSPYATAISCSSRRDYDFFIIAEIPFYIGPIGFVDYLPPGSEELADAVVDAVKKYNMVLLQNHGQVTVGKNFDDVIQKACFFELACKILLCGKELAPIRPESVAALFGAAGNKKV
jgi:ribulose-5-phosphate 4-epimerase/fuculose-1-phosphate aldolase